MFSPHASFRSVADVREIEKVPLGARLKARNAYDLIRCSAEEYPEEPALVWLPNGRAADTAVVYSYRRFFALVTQAANLLYNLGLRPGRAVSYLLPNLPETHFLLWGGAAAGQVSPINPLLSAEQIARIMVASDSRVLLTTAPDVNPDLWDKARAVRRLLPEFEHLVVVGRGRVDAGTVSFEEEMARQRADVLVSGRVIAPDDPATYFHTGGTTGAPKLSQQTHWNQVCSAWIAAYVLGAVHGDRFLVGLPLFHANAAIMCGLTALGSGGTIVLAGQNGFRSKDTQADFWRIVERHRVTIFSAVPTILATLLDVPLQSADVSSLRVCFCGAAPLSVSLFRAFEAATGVKILEAYGMTETLFSTINPRDGERRIGSVGVRVPYVEVKTAVLDSDACHIRDCEAGEVGVILMRGETVTPGYKQPEFNSQLWPQPGWLNSGDLARRDADGYFWLTGRAKDLIIRGGHNIDPAIIEEALHRHPAVELAAAVGKPDAYAGEVPVAFVTLRPGSSADPDALRTFAQANVPERPAAPAYVRILDEMPMTAVGKIFKSTLREWVVQDTLESALAAWSVNTGANATVTVANDKVRGLVASITVTPARDQTGEAACESARCWLMRYPVTMDFSKALCQ